MPIDLASRFLTNIDDLVSYRLLFQDQSLVDSFHLLHLLHEHGMVMAPSDNQMSLFVSSSRESFLEIVDFLRSCVSETGEIMETCSTSGLLARFSPELLEKFFTGSAKLITVDDFLTIFRCSCPPVTTWFSRWEFPGGPEPDALMTLFMNNVLSLAQGKPLSRCTLSYYMYKLEGWKGGVTREELPKLPRFDYSKYPQRGTVVMLRGTTPPPFERDGLDCALDR